MKKNVSRFFTFLVGASIILSPLNSGIVAATATNTALKNAQIFLVDPPAATFDTPSIAVRGSDWGSYNDRGVTHAWFFDQETNQMFELKLLLKYRDCYFSITFFYLAGGCYHSMNKVELFLRV